MKLKVTLINDSQKKKKKKNPLVFGFLIFLFVCHLFRAVCGIIKFHWNISVFILPIVTGKEKEGTSLGAEGA